MRLARRNRGFTLVELLVVMSLISLLIALLLPALSRARFVSQGARCLSNHHQMYSALGAYCGDNKNLLPQIAARNSFNTEYYLTSGATLTQTISNLPSATPSHFAWFGLGRLIYYGYMDSGEMNRCPLFSTNDPANAAYQSWKMPSLVATNTGYMSGWGQVGELGVDIIGTYAYNSDPYYDRFSNTNSYLGTMRSIGQFGEPGCKGGEWESINNYKVQHITSLIQCYTTGALNSKAVTHNTEGVNSTFIDGHAKWVSVPDTIWNGFNSASTAVTTYGNGLSWSGCGMWSYATYVDAKR